jgi:hypothetical protein
MTTDNEPMKTQTQTPPQQLPILGVDIGRVIISGEHNPNGDTSFFSGTEAEMLVTPMVAGAFAAIATLTSQFQGRTWLVSKCGPAVAERSMRWLGHHRFWETTGVSPTSVRFCRERRQKAGIAKELGLTHFVDDKLDVISSLAGIVDHRFLFGPQTKLTPNGAFHCATWDDVLRLIAHT